MKKSIVIVFIGVAALLATIVLPGCATPTVTSVPIVQAVPAGTMVPVTTTVSVVGSNGIVTVTFSTNMVATTVPMLVTNGWVNTTNYAPNPVLMQIHDTAGAIGPVVTTAVPGYGAMAGLIIGVIGLIAGGVGTGVAVYKNGVANQHLSTLQAVISGVENALPAVQQAITTTAASGVLPANMQSYADQAAKALSAVKGSISTATNASPGTQANLITVAGTVGAGPLAV